MSPGNHSRKTIKLLFLIGALLLANLACQALSGGEPGELAVEKGTQEAQLAEVATLQAALDQATQNASATKQALDVGATKTAEAAESGLSGTQQALEATATAKGGKEALSITATANAVRQATAQAQPLANLVKKLQTEGILSRIEGAYSPIEDFDQSWAQINWYQWTPTGFSPENFVIHANAAWDSASDKANWFNSGCGFVFSFKDKNNHHLIFLGLDGMVYLERVSQGNYKSLGKEYYGKLSIPKGEAELTLAVVDKNINFLVNGKRVIQRYDAAVGPGALNLTLLSGTNKDFGTRCQMTNIGLWELK